MDIEAIKEAMMPAITGRGLFLVDLKITRENDITLTVESAASSVTLDDCEALNRLFTGIFSQDEEDYSLTVTSAGLDAAFKVQAQFDKARGRKVELWLKGGRKTVGILEDADDTRVRVDGIDYPRTEVNKVKYHIEF